jgi:hypothetical protein
VKNSANGIPLPEALREEYSYIERKRFILQDVLLGFIFSTIRDSHKRKYFLTDIFPLFPTHADARQASIIS